VIGGARYLWLVALRSRAALIPLAAALFAVVGVFAGARNEVGPSWALTSMLCCALVAWFVFAVLDAEPQPQCDIVTVALGGHRGRRRLEVSLVLSASLSASALFIAYPTVLGRFDRAPGLGDLVAAALAHVASGLLGGGIAILFSRPRLTRRASAITAILVTLVLLVASGSVSGVVGPFGVAQQLSDARADTLTINEIAAVLSCVALAAGLLQGATLWGERAG
jgi:hypothetical protein